MSLKTKIDNFFSKKRTLKSDVLFVGLFTIFSICYYDSVLDKGPLNMHIWRQADCLSLTENYYKGADFLQPEMHVLLGDDLTSGKSAGEFPILYYTVGMIWKVFGKSYFSYRLFYLFILFAGVFAFYKSLSLLLKDVFWAACLAALLYTSPLYVVYSVSFLTDAPAFSFVLVGLYFSLIYYQKKKSCFFFWAMFFFALAGLIKVSCLIAFLFLFFIFLLESIFSINTLRNAKVYKGSLAEWLGFASVIAAIFGWYYYAHLYNSIHHFKYTFNDIHPIWITDAYSGDHLVKGLRNTVSQIFFSRPILFLFLFGGIVNLTLKNRMPLFAYLANVVIILAGITYFVLWAPLMGVHDYYYNCLLIFFPGIFIPFVWYMKTNHAATFKGISIKLFLSLFLLFNFLYCLSVVKLKTLAEDGSYIMVGNDSFVSEMKWFNQDASENWKRFERMRPYLQEIGVAENAKVICLSDPTFNASLYLSGHKGWTDYLNYHCSEDIQTLIEKGASYLFIYKDEVLNQDFIKPFLTQQVGEFEGIKIFKLNKNMYIKK
jgi:hypothetical protein